MSSWRLWNWEISYDLFNINLWNIIFNINNESFFSNPNFVCNSITKCRVFYALMWDWFSLFIPIDRRYVQLELDEDSFDMPLDVIGFIFLPDRLLWKQSLALFWELLEQPSYIQANWRISLPLPSFKSSKMQFITSNYRTSEQVHSRKIFRNVLRTRGFIFNFLNAK